MKLIEQGYEIIDRDSMTAAQLIELCGRTCYKSEDKITDESANDFVFMIAGRRHLSVLEHATMAFEVPWEVYADFKMADHEITKLLNITSVQPKDKGYRFVVSANLRAWFEFLSHDASAILSWEFSRPMMFAMLKIRWLIGQYCEPAYRAFFREDIEPTWRNATASVRPIKLDDMTEIESDLHQYITVRFVTNRGVTHELVRHRTASYSQESTRYVNYGGDEMEFIKPVWWDDEKWGAHIEKRSKIVNDKVLVFRPEEGSYLAKDLYAMLTFFESCASAEAKYNQCLKWGWRPEQAREVLPNSLKTEIVVTARVKDWRHILSQRTTKAAHPQIRELMNALIKKLKHELFEEVLNEVSAA